MKKSFKINKYLTEAAPKYKNPENIWDSITKGQRRVAQVYRTADLMDDAANEAKKLGDYETASELSNQAKQLRAWADDARASKEVGRTQSGSGEDGINDLDSENSGQESQGREGNSQKDSDKDGKSSDSKGSKGSEGKDQKNNDQGKDDDGNGEGQGQDQKDGENSKDKKDGSGSGKSDKSDDENGKDKDGKSEGDSKGNDGDDDSEDGKDSKGGKSNSKSNKSNKGNDKGDGSDGDSGNNESGDDESENNGDGSEGAEGKDSKNKSKGNSGKGSGDSESQNGGDSDDSSSSQSGQSGNKGQKSQSGNNNGEDGEDNGEDEDEGDDGEEQASDPFVNPFNVDPKHTRQAEEQDDEDEDEENKKEKQNKKNQLSHDEKIENMKKALKALKRGEKDGAIAGFKEIFKRKGIFAESYDKSLTEAISFGNKTILDMDDDEFEDILQQAEDMINAVKPIAYSSNRAVRVQKINAANTQENNDALDREDHANKKAERRAKDINMREINKYKTDSLPDENVFKEDLYWAIRDQVKKMEYDMDSWGVLDRRHVDDDIVVPGIYHDEKKNPNKIPLIQVYMDISGSFHPEDIRREEALMEVISKYVQEGRCKVELIYFNNILYFSRPADSVIGHGGTGAWSKIVENIEKTNPKNVLIVTDKDMNTDCRNLGKHVVVEGYVWYIWKSTLAPELPQHVEGQSQTAQYKLSNS